MAAIEGQICQGLWLFEGNKRRWKVGSMSNINVDLRIRETEDASGGGIGRVEIVGGGEGDRW